MMKKKSKKKSKKKPANKHTVNRGTLAALLGVTASRVSQFVKQGMPAVRSGTRGRPAAYDPSKCVSWLLAREREKVQALELENGTEDRELKRWRIAKLKQEWEREAGILVVSDKRDRLEAERVVAARTRLMQIPRDAVLRGVPEQHEALLQELIDDACHELAATLGEDE